MNKYQKLLHETYVLTGEGKLDAFKTYLSENVSWTEAAGFPYAGTYIGPGEVVKTYMNVLAQNGMTIALKMKSMLLITILLSCMENIVGHIKLQEIVHSRFCHLYKFDENDKVKKFIQIVDSATVNEVLS